MQYDQIKYVPEDQDPSLTIETEKLIARIIDNTGLLNEPDDNCRSYFGKYGTNSFVPFSHHLGYHGIRTLYDRIERRNLVVPLVSWFNLQGVNFRGIENDPVDERSWAGVARGWPIRMEPKGEGVLLAIDPMPETQFAYTIEFQPAMPDGIDISVRFIFHRKPDTEPARFHASWPCYMNACDDVRFLYPKGKSLSNFQWASLGEKPDIIIGEPVGYRHQQTLYLAEEQAVPVGYGRIGKRTLALMFNDPRVTFFVVNAGGHYPISAVQNPAWDLSWTVDDYPLNEPVGFDARLIYTYFKDPQTILERYREWIEE